MSLRFLYPAAFAAGLAVVVWIGAGYLATNLLAMSLVALVGAFFVAGALELRRFRGVTAGLVQVLAKTTEPPPALAPWLARLPAGLRHAVRLRLDGERVALPGPVLSSYLVGLLVLLGMLGTFLGMVVTLRGTGLALANAADVESIRASLAAPVQGLGQAFGCSIAGVAASAMLGLMSALARRERQRAMQQLDACLATPLRGFSRAHQREESLRLQAAQAEAMPALMNQLQGLVAQMERQGQSLQQGLLAGQAQFHDEAQRAYTALAVSVDRSLQTSLADSVRLAGAAIEPAVQSTLAGLAREAATLRESLGHAVQRQLDDTTAKLDGTAASLADRWQAALAGQQHHHEALTVGLQAGLDRFAQTFERRSTALVDGVAERLDRSAQQWDGQWS